MHPRKSHKKLVGILVATTFGMLLFAFAMVPLYDAFCEMTGLNNKGGRVRVEIPTEIDASRTINIKFITHVNGEMPWEFYAHEKTIEVHPGEVKKMLFHTKNNTPKDMRGQFVATISPASSDRYVKKTECFSFNRQDMDPLEEKELPVTFFIDKDIPDDIKEIILFYTLFDNTPGANT